MKHVEEITQQKPWDAHVTANNGHPLQLWGWGEVKRSSGWTVRRLQVATGSLQGGAQVLERQIPGIGRTIAYIPRGPFVNSESDKDFATITSVIAAYLRKNSRAIVVKIEPQRETISLPSGWRTSKSHILIPNTLILDLHHSEDDLMADIQSKRRYDIRKSTERVADFHIVRSREELDQVLVLYAETAKRAGFALHPRDYYTAIYDQLGDNSQIVAAWNEAGELLAFTWFVTTPLIAFELYSGINSMGQKLRANYGLKWYAITEMKRQGIALYDFNGLLNDGISDFKRSFASHDNLLVGTYDLPLSAPLYHLWETGLPLAKQVARRLKG